MYVFYNSHRTELKTQYIRTELKLNSYFLRARASIVAVARISYGNSVPVSVRLSQLSTVLSLCEIETWGFYHMIALESIVFRDKIS